MARLKEYTLNNACLMHHYRLFVAPRPVAVAPTPDVLVLFLGLRDFSTGEVGCDVDEAVDSLEERRTERPPCVSSGSALLALEDRPERLFPEG